MPEEAAQEPQKSDRHAQHHSYDHRRGGRGGGGGGHPSGHRGYRGGRGPGGHYQHHQQHQNHYPPYQPPPILGHYHHQPPPPMPLYMGPPPPVPAPDMQPPFYEPLSIEIDPGMNGDGWQGPQGSGGGGGGRGHHMSGGRRGGGMHQNNRMPPQHHGGPGGMGGGMGPPPHRMMTPSYRPQQQQQQPQFVYPMGVPDVMDMNILRMNEMSLNGQPSMPPNGMYGDMIQPPPQGNWSQPAPFASQDELYDQQQMYGGGPPPQQQNGMHGGGNGGAPYGGNSNRNGGYNRGMQQNNRGQSGGYHRNQQGGYQPMHNQHPMSQHNQQGQYYQPQQQQYGQPFGQSNQQMQQHDQMSQHSGQGSGFQMEFSGNMTMDDYSMWTDENDEETKKKKILRDKGLLAWGDAETSNAKPIRKWIVGDGLEEDFETAMTRCPIHLKKKTMHEENLRRRLASENPQIAQQAQQQLDEERNAMQKVGRRPIVACGWGDLPEMGDKNGSGPSTSEARNPFFAQHMQQHNQGQQGYDIDLGWPGMMDNVPGNVPLQPMNVANLAMMPHLGLDSTDENRVKVAENLRCAVEKGHLDIGLLSLTHIPPNVLDLLAIILAKIPVLDEHEAVLKTLIESTRPATAAANDDPKSWLNEAQQGEHDKHVISVVTAKIEVGEMSKKINRALQEAGLMGQSGAILQPAQMMPNNMINMVPLHHQQPGAQGSSQLSQMRGDNFENGPPDHCDYYDYSFLG